MMVMFCLNLQQQQQGYGRRLGIDYAGVYKLIYRTKFAGQKCTSVCNSGV
jgi:hypothetical protein